MGPEARAPTAKELREQALRRLLRGGTWEALVREIGWTAVCSTGAEPSCLDWLAGMLELRLAEHVNRLEGLIEWAGSSARAEHLQSWPNDLSGAETAAILAGHEEAAQALSRLYADVLDWACELVAERPRRRRLFRRALRLRSAGPNAQVELPALVTEDLARSGERFGSPA